MPGLWLEAQQSLRTSPKLRRAARQLGIEPVYLIGHLMCMWWWALDHADDGDLSSFEDEDVADAAEWDGDPSTFVKALVDCGPGSRSGFLERDGAYGAPDAHLVGDLVIHDWWDYAGRLIESRITGQEGAHQRWHVKRGKPSDDCELCHPNGIPNRPPLDPHKAPNADAYGPLMHPTRPDHTEPNTEDPLSDADATDAKTGYVCTVKACRCDDETVRELTRVLARGIKANGHKMPTTAKANHDWRAAIDLLLRRDDATEQEVRDLAAWATQDEFWRANIQSATKFREKFNQLRLRRQQRSGPAAHNGRGTVALHPSERKPMLDDDGNPVPGVRWSETS